MNIIAQRQPIDPFNDSLYHSKTSIERRFPNNRLVSNKRQVSNKRPGLLEIQTCQSTSHTLVTSLLPPTLNADTDNSLFFLANQLNVHAEN